MMQNAGADLGSGWYLLSEMRPMEQHPSLEMKADIVRGTTLGEVSGRSVGAVYCGFACYLWLDEPEADPWRSRRQRSHSARDEAGRWK